MTACDMSSMIHLRNSGFAQKPLANIKSFGERLREHRESIPISLDKLAKLINVEIKYLSALEQNDYKNLPPNVYVTHFIKKYAEQLGLNPETAVLLFKKERTVFDRAQKKKEQISRLKNLLRLFFSPAFLRMATLAIVALGVLLYLGIKFYDIIKPPELYIANLTPEFSTTEKNLTLNGKSESEAFIKINDRQIVSDKTGNFTLTLNLQKGLNIIKISAEKKHSREKVLYYQIVLNEITK